MHNARAHTRTHSGTANRCATSDDRTAHDRAAANHGANRRADRGFYYGPDGGSNRGTYQSGDSRADPGRDVQLRAPSFDDNEHGGHRLIDGHPA